MTYNETLQFLFSQLPMYQRDGNAAYKDNLDNTEAFDQYFNHPHRGFTTIHVAGTNGKGSVSHMLAAVLQSAGYKTGLYTSPHLKDFRERIRINGEMIPEVEVVAFVEKHQQKIQHLSPSFFEMTVAMAFDYFNREQVDIAVIETGMGGRLDSTNIITPLVSVITNIGLDHTRFLGNTLPAIATEKAGIIKEGVPVVIGEWHQETAPVFLKKSIEKRAEIVFADKIRQVKATTREIDKTSYAVFKEEQPEYLELTTDLTGDYQKQNLQTVLSVFDVLNKELNVSKESIQKGVLNVKSFTGFKGRWQVLYNRPKIVCDTGHNQEGIKQIVKQLANEKYRKLHIVFGMVNDKDADEILTLMPKNAKYYFTKAQIPRSLNEQDLMKMANKHGLFGTAYDTVLAACKAARQNIHPDDIIFIGGSTFVVAEVPGV